MTSRAWRAWKGREESVGEVKREGELGGTSHNGKPNLGGKEWGGK